MIKLKKAAPYCNAITCTCIMQDLPSFAWVLGHLQDQTGWNLREKNECHVQLHDMWQLM